MSVIMLITFAIVLNDGTVETKKELYPIPFATFDACQSFANDSQFKHNQWRWLMEQYDVIIDPKTVKGTCVGDLSTTASNLQ